MNDLKQKFKKIILIIGDIVLLYLSLFVVLKLRFSENYNSEVLIQHLYPFSIIYIFWIAIFYINNLYSINHSQNTYRFYASIVKSFIFNSVFSVIFFYFFYSSTGLTPKTNLLLNILIFSALFICWRIFYNYFIKTRTFSTNIAILNNDKEAEELKRKIIDCPQIGYTIINYSLSDITNFKDFIIKNNIKLVITSNKFQTEDPILLHELYESLSLKIKFENFPNFYEQILEKIPLSIIDKIWFLENIKNLDRPFYDLFKRFIDIAIASIGLIISSFFYPLIIIAIKLNTSGPAFIIQKRIGQNNQVFKNIKFRSMIINDNGVWPKENDERITKVGRILRKTRIDEFPQLLNIIKGDISLVGPRPDIIDLYKKLESEIPYYKIRNITKPGLTGWAQIHQEIPPHSIEATKQRLAYDFYYIKNKSFIIDIIVILKTIKTLLSTSGR